MYLKFRCFFVPVFRKFFEIDYFIRELQLEFNSSEITAFLEIITDSFPIYSVQRPSAGLLEGPSLHAISGTHPMKVGKRDFRSRRKNLASYEKDAHQEKWLRGLRARQIHLAPISL